MNTADITTIAAGTSIVNPFGSTRDTVTFNGFTREENEDGDIDYMVNVTDASGKTFNVITPDAEVELA